MCVAKSTGVRLVGPEARMRGREEGKCNNTAAAAISVGKPELIHSQQTAAATSFLTGPQTFKSTQQHHYQYQAAFHADLSLIFLSELKGNTFIFSILVIYNNIIFNMYL